MAVAGKRKSRKKTARVETGTAEQSEGVTQRIAFDGWEAIVEWAGPGEAAVGVERRDGVTLVHFDLPAGPLGEYHLRIRRPFVDIHRSWVGHVDQWRGSELTSIALNYTYESRANSSMPIVCNYNRAGENRGVIAMLNQAPQTTVNQRPVLDQPPMQWLQTSFTRRRVRGGMRETIVLCREPIHYAAAVANTQRLLARWNNIAPLPAPAWAREPVWCSWYSHLYVLKQHDIEAQIPHLKAMGIRTVLIDASWFKTPQTAYHWIWGDYHVEKSQMPDLPGLSRRLHGEGLKLMLWCAPLYVGAKAQARRAMEPYRAFDGKQRHDRLCPFCPEAVEHASRLVGRLMREYDLDGLKLDFMSEGDDPPCVDPKHDHGDGDYGRAMLGLMAGVRDAILEVKPDAAIEYRIGYSTLCTLNMANCHRGNDAPYDADYMRRENQFLRLFCDAPAAVWNDYAYWHPDESAENVSLMLGQQVFSGGVPTLSVDLASLRDDHRHVLRNWLDFYREHRDALAGATLRVHSADSCFSVASLENPARRVAYLLVTGACLPRAVSFTAGIERVWILNAGAEERGSIVLQSAGGGVRAELSDRQPHLFNLNHSEP